MLITEGAGAEDTAEFNQLLRALREDLAPVGTLEEMLVEKIAVCWWRQRRALRCEAGIVRRAFETPAPFSEQMDYLLKRRTGITDHLSLPLGAELDQILRYETSIQRQLAYAINQLEALAARPQRGTRTGTRASSSRVTSRRSSKRLRSVPSVDNLDPKTQGSARRTKNMTVGHIQAGRRGRFR